MLRNWRLWVFGILILAIGFVTVYDQLHYAQAKSFNIDCIQGSSPGGGSDSLTCTANNADKAQTGENSPPKWHVFVVWPEGITAILLLLTLGAIVWQAVATQAAAQAQIDGNRAWIFADLKKLGDISHSIKSLQEEPLQTYLLASLHLRNEGLSPAWIDSVQGHMEIWPRTQKPPRRVKFDLCPYISTIRVKGEEVFNPEFECLGNLTKETDWLFIWVLIKYHDGHGIQGETSLGYAMSMAGALFRQSDIPERNYNK
jgi:hypothetical protein